jgi:hypothetical protein
MISFHEKMKNFNQNKEEKRERERVQLTHNKPMTTVPIVPTI